MFGCIKMTNDEVHELNVKAVETLETKGTKEFVKHVFTHPDDLNKPEGEKRELSYAEMRMLYG
jgi:hypothetical protein